MNFWNGGCFVAGGFTHQTYSMSQQNLNTLMFIINTSPSVSVALRRIGTTLLKLTAAMQPYSSLIFLYWFGIFGIDGTSN